MKKILSIILSITLLFSAVSTAFSSDNYDIEAVIADTADYLQRTVSNPQIGSVGGDWTVFALARSGADIADYYEKYYANAVDYICEKNGVLHTRKYTEYSRVIITLTAIGKNAEDIDGYNLTAPLLDYDTTVSQGLNGAIWAVIALDCGSYGGESVKEQYISYILSRQLPDGGWAVSTDEQSAGPDITAMALTALSGYTEREAVSEAVENGIKALSAMQNADGGFSSYGAASSESVAQVITALSTLGMAYDDERFVKNGNTLLSCLMSYYAEGQGFLHTSDGDGANLMATEQCLYALVALQRLSEGKTAIFNMSKTESTDNISIEFAPEWFEAGVKALEFIYMIVRKVS